MRSGWIAAAGLVVAVALVSGCSGGGSSRPKAAVVTTASASSASSPTPTEVALSAEWVPKLQALSKVKDCQSPSSTECGTAVSNIVAALNELMDDMAAADAEERYPKTIDEISSLVGKASGYADEGCEGDPSADSDSSPCYGYAVGLTVGVSGLTFVLQTDEVKAGVSPSA